MKKLYEVITSKQYEKDVRLAVRRGLDIEKLLEVVRLLRNGEPLPEKHRNHLLHGDYKGYWECHVTPDWLLLYAKDTITNPAEQVSFCSKNLVISEFCFNFVAKVTGNGL